MSIRTIVEFNNDFLHRIHEAGHISDELLQLIIWGGPDGYRPEIQGVEVKDAVHHSTEYSIEYGPHRQKSTAL